MSYSSQPRQGIGTTLVSRSAYPGVGAFDANAILGQPPKQSDEGFLDKLGTGLKESAKWLLEPVRQQIMQGPGAPPPAAAPTFYQKYKTPIWIVGGIALAGGLYTLLKKKK